jgi:hypothetical protein
VSQLFVMPMFFVSGAFFPVSDLPARLGVLNRIDPLTYAVDPMRHVVFDHLDVSESARRTLDPGISWWGWQLPPWFEAGLVLLLGLALMASRSGRSRGRSDDRARGGPATLASCGVASCRGPAPSARERRCARPASPAAERSRRASGRPRGPSRRRGPGPSP